jgi:hypothetical protein
MDELEENWIHVDGANPPRRYAENGLLFLWFSDVIFRID